MFRSMSVTPLNTTVSQMRFYMDGSQYSPVQSLEAVRKILRQQGFITQHTEKAKPGTALAILSQVRKALMYLKKDDHNPMNKVTALRAMATAAVNKPPAGNTKVGFHAKSFLQAAYYPTDEEFQGFNYEMMVKRAAFTTHTQKAKQFELCRILGLNDIQHIMQFKQMLVMTPAPYIQEEAAAPERNINGGLDSVGLTVQTLWGGG